MNEHPAYLVYTHLGAYLRGRGLAPAGGGALDTPRDRFVSELDLVGYFSLEAEGPGRRAVVVLLLAPGGKYSEQGPALRGLLGGLDGTPAAREGRLAEAIVVAPEEVLRKNNMTEVIERLRRAAAEEGAGRGAALAGAYEMYPYHVFSLEIPRAQAVPRHEIADPAEVRAFLAQARLTLGDLRRVLAASPPVVWAGAKAGQVVKISGFSETAGLAVDYCLVV